MTSHEIWERGERFNAHLDQCQQCRDHPFELCPSGVELLKRVGGESLANSVAEELKAKTAEIAALKASLNYFEMAKNRASELVVAIAQENAALKAKIVKAKAELGKTTIGANNLEFEYEKADRLRIGIEMAVEALEDTSE